MNGFEATRVFIHALEATGVDYMVAGSLSSMLSAFLVRPKMQTS
ncbi:MAG: hypothetical protein JWO89_857 [Verrucomicrobiaceae bacterium]|nr:hypothetical protein [Verrucomicrobiaceae bacterium]